MQRFHRHPHFGFHALRDRFRLRRSGDRPVDACYGPRRENENRYGSVSGTSSIDLCTTCMRDAQEALAPEQACARGCLSEGLHFSVGRLRVRDVFAFSTLSMYISLHVSQALYSCILPKVVLIPIAIELYDLEKPRLVSLEYNRGTKTPSPCVKNHNSH